jgi:hypothetical protein
MSMVDLLLFKKLLHDEVPQSASFDEQWQVLQADYVAWLATPIAHNTSELNQRLELLRRAAAMFGAGVLTSQALVGAALAGTASVGDTLVLQVRGGHEQVTVVSRSITDRLTVMYVLERSNGTRFSYEFSD